MSRKAPYSKANDKPSSTATTTTMTKTSTAKPVDQSAGQPEQQVQTPVGVPSFPKASKSSQQEPKPLEPKAQVEDGSQQSK